MAAVNASSALSSGLRIVAETILTGSGTHTFNAATKYVDLFLTGGGGGGAGGPARGAGDQSGYQGGGPGEAMTLEIVPVSLFGASAAYAIGAGGLGGAGSTFTGINGGASVPPTVGTAGGQTTFGGLKVAGGAGGLLSASTGFSPIFNPRDYYSQDGYRTPRLAFAGSPPTPADYKGPIGSGGGASGQWYSNTHYPPTAGAAILGLAAAAGAHSVSSATPATPGADGLPHKAGAFIPGQGGGGGGSAFGSGPGTGAADNRTAGRGGHGGLGGGGGGAGGFAVVFGNVSATAIGAAGGNGGAGIIMVREWA